MTTPTTEATVISIPAQPAYSLSPNSRAHWRKRHLESREAKAIVRIEWGNMTHGAFTPLQPVHGPVLLTWTVYKGKGRKSLDRDNLIPCLKPFMDGLVECGIIDGDTPDIVTAIHVEQVSYQDHGGPLGEIECRIEPAGRTTR
jgi:hypothetical protein